MGRQVAAGIGRHCVLLAMIGLNSVWVNRVDAQSGKLELRVVEGEDKQPTAARIHLLDPKGKPVLPKTLPSWKNHFVFRDKVVLNLKPGKYTFEMERGLEYRTRFGHFIIENKSDDIKTVEMNRFTDMKKQGWWSGELHIHRPLKDVPLLMDAEDLHVAPTITWWNKRNPWTEAKPPAKLIFSPAKDRWIGAMGGEDERGGGALLFFGLSKPLEIQEAAREWPASTDFLLEAKKINAGVHIDIEKPFWWDFPIWIASQKIDSIGIAHNHMWRGGVLANEAWGRPRDKARYPGTLGNGRYTLQIYYHLLNCGLRIPPSAGSASGVLPNPVGYNRVYVHCDEFNYENWFRGLREGKVVVTNGPLIRPLVNGKLPGHVFRVAKGEAIELEAALSLSTRDKVEYLEMIKDGRVIREVRLDEYAKARGRLPKVKFDKSGWYMIRAVTNNAKTYRFASTGPYYVEVDGKRRISKTSAKFFTDWLEERARNLRLKDPEEQADVMRFVKGARAFWKQISEAANAE